MAKKPFTTRLDEAVLDTAQRIAEAEHRSITNVIEVAVLAYAKANPPGPTPAEPHEPP